VKRPANHPFPGFDEAVPKNGYLWWYIDAVSDDGEQALTLIAFVGSVFSPYYAWARKHAPAEPLDHCALNVALYQGRGKKRWAMTERPRTAVHRSVRRLEIGPSSLHWDGQSLDIRIEEMTVPVPSRIRGRIRLWPTQVTDHEIALDCHGRHHWRPVAPCARLEVSLSHPRLHWSGSAYWDSNAGERPLEEDFDSWEWSRTSRSGDTVILYDIVRRQGGALCLALAADRAGGLSTLTPPEAVQLADTRWRVARHTRAERGDARVRETLEDTPFYARSLLNTGLRGGPVTTVHESLSLGRFSSAWVRWLLPFRMPRARR